MKSVLNLVFVFLYVSCLGTKQAIVKDGDCMEPSAFFELSDTEKYFDVSLYELELKAGGVILKDDAQIKSELMDLGDNEVTVIDTDKSQHITKWKRYKNGIIKRLFVEYDYGSARIGKQLEFDEKGTLVNTINYDKGYTICWLQAIAIVKQIARKDIKKYQIDRFYLMRNDLNEFPQADAEWRVSMEGNESYDQDGTTFYVIDGITGKLKRRIRAE